jgi:hypothetical protein
VVQLGKKPSVKKGACPDDEISCAAAQHDKSKCFLAAPVTGDGAEERERWHVRLPEGYPKGRRVLLLNPKNGAAVVCSQEASASGGKCQGHAEVPEAGVQQDEFKDKATGLAASYETFWKLSLPRTGGDAVVLCAFVAVDAPLGPLADDAIITLKKK